MPTAEQYTETVSVPRAVRFPVEVAPPEGFDPERADTWPCVDGRLEFVDGRLLYMPPCGDLQQDTVADVVGVLLSWVHEHAEFVLGTNEAGMRLGQATRAADAALWRREDLGGYTDGFRHVPPVLAVEVAGESECGQTLREKARWYLEVGVPVVWLVYPKSREVVVITEAGERRVGAPETMPEHPLLPGLKAEVAAFFLQISRGRS